MNPYTVRISVLERKPVRGPGGVFGQQVQDKLLDASVTLDNLDDIRDVVDGLLFEGIPATQRDEEKECKCRVSAQGRVILPPTVDESGDIPGPLGDLIRDGATGQFVVMPSSDPEYRTPVPERMTGGKHSGDCKCSRCAEPDPDEVTPIKVPDSFITPRPIRDNPQA